MTPEARYICSNCRRTWISYLDTPGECPLCGIPYQQYEDDVSRKKTNRRAISTVSKDIVDEINRLYESGLGCIQISIRKDLSVQTVINVVKTGKGKDFKPMM